MRKIICCLLVLSMMLCSSAVAFADTTPAPIASQVNGTMNIEVVNNSQLYAATAYKEGVNDISVSTKGVTVYLSKKSANAAVQGGITLAGVFIPSATVAKAAAVLVVGTTFVDPFKGGIWFFCKWSDLGISAVKALTPGVQVFGKATPISSAGYQ